MSETECTVRPLLDLATRSRCYHPAEILADRGYRCTIASAETFFDAPVLDHDVYVFHRPDAARPNLRQVVKTLRKSGAVLVADIDDLIFGPADLARTAPAVGAGASTEEEAVAAFQGHLDGLRLFDRVTASTEPLAAYVREANPEARVLVLPDTIPPSLRILHDALGTPFQRRPTERIGYFADEQGGAADLAIVASVLERILLENPQASLFVAGSAALPRRIAALPNVTVAPVVEDARRIALMATCGTVIAPRAASTFNAFRSRTDVLYAALAGCRLVATPIPDLDAIGAEYLTRAASLDDWYEALSEAPGEAERLTAARRRFESLGEAATMDGFDSLVE